MSNCLVCNYPSVRDLLKVSVGYSLLAFRGRMNPAGSDLMIHTGGARDPTGGRVLFPKSQLPESWLSGWVQWPVEL